jgi:hypothetical protein
MSDLEEQYESDLSYEDFEEPLGEGIDQDSGRESQDFEEPLGEGIDQDFKLEMFEEPLTEMDSSGNYLSQRFLELQQRQFESPQTRNAAVDGLLNEVEKQYFLGKLTGGVLKNLLKKLIGGVIPGNPIKIIKGAIALVRMAAKEPLRSALINAISLNPALAPARPLLSLLGVAETPENTENSLDRWKEFTKLTELMYEDIINNMDREAVNDPVAANRLASQAFGKAASQIRARTTGRHYRRRRRTIYLRPGEYVVVRGSRRF